MHEMTLDGLYLFAFMILVLPVIVLVAWALVQGFQKGGRFWRGLAVGLLASASTVGAVVGWWFGAGNLLPAEDLWIIIWVFGLLIIPIIGVAVGILAVFRVARAPEAVGSVDG